MNKNNKSDNRQKLFEKRFAESIKEVKNPKKNALIVMVIWLIVITAFVIAISFVNNRSILWNINFGFTLMVIIAIIWFLSRIGVLESTKLKFANWRNEKVIKDLKLQKKIKLSLSEYRDIQKKKSWVGITLLSSIGITGLIITLIILLL